MMKSLKALILALIIPPLVGCGTITNLTGGFKYPEGDARIYGGVLTDLEAIDKCCNAGSSSNPGSGLKSGSGSPYVVLLIPILVLTEGVLTFTGDTLTLPYTMYMAHQRASADKYSEGRVPRTVSGTTEVEQNVNK